MGVTLDLFLNAVSAGLLLGGFYAAVSVGVAISSTTASGSTRS